MPHNFQLGTKYLQRDRDEEVSRSKILPRHKRQVCHTQTCDQVILLAERA